MQLARGVSGSHTTGNTTGTTAEAKCKSYRYEDPQSSGGTEASTIGSSAFNDLPGASDVKFATNVETGLPQDVLVLGNERQQNPPYAQQTQIRGCGDS
ncbi:hypothetical protein PI124_g3281 [Phytophthora idaei]|nr:hypothetical protein PI125_g2801 [Phytophthora idaei]KAG3169761.1 hypothetical protein PI126_g2610 [Phytophthora idaei]KAG3252076.1 hypothetical protein PI124_g3281 [Phytophthora idaei]